MCHVQVFGGCTARTILLLFVKYNILFPQTQVTLADIGYLVQTLWFYLAPRILTYFRSSILSLNVPDQGNYRNALCTLNQISTFSSQRDEKVNRVFTILRGGSVIKTVLYMFQATHFYYHDKIPHDKIYNVMYIYSKLYSQYKHVTSMKQEIKMVK